jgi:hypothetical protein
MRTHFLPLAAAAVLCLAAPAARAADPAEPDPKGVEFFENKIRPVLVAHCYSCHSADAAKGNKLKAGLALDTRDGLRKGGETGPAIVPGKPDQSLLVKTMRYAADAPEMPPKGKLPDAVVADFEAWVKMGAPDPRAGAAAVARKGMSLEDGRTFWAFVPPASPAAPAVRDAAWPLAAADRFVLAAMEAKGLKPVADADRRSLARRVAFDLIGLPPAPEDVEAFAADPAPDAYEKLVDRLLASPHFGERWGRHWLDAARYADSNGRDRNVLWFHAWRYRNYVFDSFNRDAAYDRFVREQVAGDLLPAADAAERDRLRVATGFLALGPKALEELKPDVFHMDVVDEQIEVIGRTVLGLSVGCARCHDHKFDPIPTRDYYAIAGVLRSTEPLSGYGPLGIKATAFHHAPLVPVGPDAGRLGAAALAYLADLHDLTLKQNAARSDRYRVVRRLTDAKLQAAKPGADKAALQADIERMEAEIKDWDAKVKAAEAELRAATENPPPMPALAMAARDRAKPVDARVHVRGETTNLGEVAPRGVLRVTPNAARPMPATASGRLELADWLADPKNPLPARVYVNRVWAHLFGRGLVTTPDDFGVNGTKPTHPELLDHLATRFVAGGWSTKKLVRELVLSRTYRLSTNAELGTRSGQSKTRLFGVSIPHSEFRIPHSVDPDNTLYWRMAPRRLEAEAFRDAVLAVSGRLDPTPPTDGPLAKVNPYRSAEYFGHQPAFAADLFDVPHRSVYLPVVRGVLPEVFQLFDFASPDRPVAARDRSTVPAQALYLLNNPWVIAQARHTAARLLATGPDDAARVERLYRLAYSRPPTSDEAARAAKYLAVPEALLPDPKAKTPATSDRLREERWTSFCQTVFASAEFRTLR